MSTPLAWTEVTARLDPARFTIKTVPDRFAKRGDPMRDVLDTRFDVAALLAALVARQLSHPAPYPGTAAEAHRP